MQNFGKIASHSLDYSFQTSPLSHLTKTNPEQNDQKMKRQLEYFLAFIQYFLNYNYEIYITLSQNHMFFSQIKVWI